MHEARSVFSITYSPQTIRKSSKCFWADVSSLADQSAARTALMRVFAWSSKPLLHWRSQTASVIATFSGHLRC